MSGCLVLGIFLINNGQAEADEAPLEGQCLCLTAIVRMAKEGDSESFICDAHVSFAGEGLSKERHPLTGINVEKLAPIPLGCALGCGKSSIEPFQCWYVKQTDRIKTVILAGEAGGKDSTGEIIILGYAITALSACGLSFITAGITVWVRSRVKHRTTGPSSPIDTLTVPHSQSHHSRVRHGTALTGGLGMAGPSGNTSSGRPRSIRPMDQVGTARSPSPAHHRAPVDPPIGSGSSPPLPVPPPWLEPAANDTEEEAEEARSGHTMSSRASQSNLLA